MRLLDRVTRHLRITRQNYRKLPSPPFLVLFINSICNMKCEHCFYWRELNAKDDLTKDEIFELSRSLGRIENSKRNEVIVPSSIESLTTASSDPASHHS